MDYEDPSVAFLVDDFGLNHVQSQFVEMFDIEQIEVYRGLKELYLVKTQQVVLFQLQLKNLSLTNILVRFSALQGQYDWNEGSINKFKLALNVPIVEGKLAMKLLQYGIKIKAL
ncbi:MAG: hypothetical protein CM15mP109_09050 [Candidatus Dadabacteria bacterium]|nr:MAG: hypothetical protein CM15mP109_09050 [Candidatus Dadabacteria bacterium]